MRRDDTIGDRARRRLEFRDALQPDFAPVDPYVARTEQAPLRGFRSAEDVLEHDAGIGELKHLASFLVEDAPDPLDDAIDSAAVLHELRVEPEAAILVATVE